MCAVKDFTMIGYIWIKGEIWIEEARIFIRELIEYKYESIMIYPSHETGVAPLLSELSSYVLAVDKFYICN